MAQPPECHISPATLGRSFKSNLYRIFNVAVYQCLHSARSSVFQKLVILLCLWWAMKTWISGDHHYLGAHQSQIQWPDLNGTVLPLKTGLALKPQSEKIKEEIWSLQYILPGQSRHKRSSKNHHEPHWEKKIQDCEMRQLLFYVTL